MSKLIEKAVANETRVYIQENSYGEPVQSAYKQFNSTETALIYVANVGYQCVNGLNLRLV